MLFKETCVRRGLKTCIHFLVVGVFETHKRRIMRVVPPECTVLQCGVNRFERTTRYLFMNLFFFLPAWSGCCGGQLSLSEVEAEREMAATAAVISDFLSTIKATGWSCSPSKSFDNSSDRILVCWPFCVSKRRACCSCKRFLNTKILGILAQILLLDCVKCFQKLFSCFSLSSLLPVLFFQGLWWTHERS